MLGMANGSLQLLSSMQTLIAESRDGAAHQHSVICVSSSELINGSSASVVVSGCAGGLARVFVLH